MPNILDFWNFGVEWQLGLTSGPSSNATSSLEKGSSLMVFMFSGKWCFYGGGKSAFIGIELERNARYFCAKVSGAVRTMVPAGLSPLEGPS